MAKVTKANAKKYSNMFAKSKGVPKTKKEWKQYIPGKCQARITASYWDKTNKDTDCLKFELKILSGENEGRIIKRTFFIEGRNPEETKTAIDKFRDEMDKLGISELKSIDEIMDSLEECIIEIGIWINPKKPENYPIPFFNKYIKGPEDEDNQEEQQEVTVIKSDDDNDDIEYDL